MCNLPNLQRSDLQEILEIEKKQKVLNKIIERYKILEELGIINSVRGN